MKQTENGVILSVRVKAGSGRFSIERKKSELKPEGDRVAFQENPPSGSSDSYEIIIRTKSPAEDNKANQEIVKELSRLFGKDVRIIRGLKSRNKEILVAGAKSEDLEKII